MSFFDGEGDDPRTAIRARPAPRAVGDDRRRGPDDRTLLIRRAGAALVVVLIVVLIVLGVKTILDHQATDALRGYAGNVNALVASEQQNVRLPFFKQLDLAYNSSNQSAVANDIQQEVQAEQVNYRTAQSWSVPAQMVAAQRVFVSVLGLRYQALQSVAAAMPAALGVAGQAAAIRGIAGDMELFLASDVLYAERVRPLIEQALATAGITGISVAPSALLPDVGWLAPQTAANRILGFVPPSLGGTPPSGSNGHALLGVTYGANVTLSSTQLNRIALGPQGVTFVLEVENSGTGTVHDVITKVDFYHRGIHASCLDTISPIPVSSPGHTYAVSVVVSPTSSCTGVYGVPLAMTAEVVPVPGETDTHNNYMHFLVDFSPAS